jgi:AraC-like DNA-binding protein
MIDAARVTGFGNDQFLAPPPALADYVLYLWRREFPPDRAVTVQPTLPDGCIDLLTVDDGGVHVMGPETVRADHRVAGGTTIVGVWLRPGVGARVFGAVATELVDRSLELSVVSRAPAPLRHAPAAASLTPTLSAYRQLIEVLVPRLAVAAPDDGVSFGVQWLGRHPSATVDDLCARLGWSPREVRRRFTGALGFGPKAMQRMVRFQRALTIARQAPAMSLSLLAASAGYADQAHMTREFRGLADATPGSLLSGPFDATLEPLWQPESLTVIRE